MFQKRLIHLYADVPEAKEVLEKAKKADGKRNFAVITVNVVLLEFRSIILEIRLAVSVL